MSDKEATIQKIRDAFGSNEYPGDTFLQGSAEGCEPFDEVQPFRGQTHWECIEPAFLDAHANALSFFSEAGLRFYLPAYLIADIRGELKSTDPVIPLTHGFSNVQVESMVKGRRFIISTGKSELINPSRYGAATFHDYARYRLSIFTREEARAIVAYLEYRRASCPDGPDRVRIDAALNGYWQEKARMAPLASSLQQHVKEKSEYVAAVQANEKHR